MSKRKKTTTTKNTTTKVKLVKKINALDMKHLLQYGNDEGLIGCAYKIIHNIIDGDTTAVKMICGKSITPITKMLDKTDIDIDSLELSQDMGKLVHLYVTNELPEHLVELGEDKFTAMLMNMLSTYAFKHNDMTRYCNDNLHNRVGMLLTYECSYDVLKDEYTTDLSVSTVDSIERWMDVSTEFVARDNATMIRG